MRRPGFHKGVSKSGKNGYRVQRTFGGVKLSSVSFKDLRLANEYSRELEDAYAANRPFPSPRLPSRPATGLSTVDAYVKLSISKRLAIQRINQARAAKSLRDWERYGAPFFSGVYVQGISWPVVVRYRDHLASRGLARATARNHLSILRCGLDLALEEGLIPFNAAKGVPAVEPENRTNESKPLSQVLLSPGQVQAIASHFRVELQLAVWLGYLMCLRMAEVLGLRLREWEPVGATIFVHRQAGTSDTGGAKGVEHTKTPASTRLLPVPAQLNELIARYVELHHGERPLEEDALAVWLDRRLIISRRSMAPWRVVIDRQWREALRAVGLDCDAVGYTVRFHDLRRSGSTVLGLDEDLPGDAWSGYMGHAPVGKTGASAVTLSSYLVVGTPQLAAAAEVMERLIEREFETLDFETYWEDTGHLTIDEAAARLDVSRGQVMQLLQDKRLWRASGPSVEHYGHLSGQMRWTRTDRLLIARDSVEQTSRHLALLHENGRSLKQVQELLGLTKDQVRRLLESNLLRTVSEESVTTVFDLDSVNECLELLHEQRENKHLYLSLAETARILRSSDALVYQLALLKPPRLTRVRLWAQTEYAYTRESVLVEAERRGISTRS